MTDHLTLTGTIGTDPEYRIDPNGLARTSFRLVTNERRRDADGNWADVHANWYRITCFARLAANAQASLHKGERVIVTGRLRLRDFERSDGTNGTSAEITASALGHDLSFATTAASRAANRSEAAASESSGAFAPSESVQAFLDAAESRDSAEPTASPTSELPEPGPEETRELALEGAEPPF